MTIAALAAAVVIPSPPAAAAEDQQVGIRLLEAPMARREDPRAHMYIVDHLNPRAQNSRRFEVLNKTDRAREFDIYAGSASLEENEFVFGEDHDGNELTSWTKL